MALDELTATIERIQKHIRDHRDSLTSREERTRQVLIDPLLSALGWDVTDPSLVELEYDVRGKRADYALKVDGKAVAVIEAKRLGKQLIDDDTVQVLNYANLAGIDYMVVTNGDQWNMFPVFERGTIEERVIMDLSISGSASYVTAIKSLVMWRANLGSGSKPVATNEPVLSQYSENDSVSEPDEPEQPIGESDKISSLLEKILSGGGNDGWVPLSGEINTKPNEIMFPDGRTIKIKTLVELWAETAEWVLERPDVKKKVMDVIDAGDKYEFNNGDYSIISSRKEDFWQNKQGRYLAYELRNGLWIDRDSHLPKFLGYMRDLLNHFEIDTRTVKLKF